MDTLECIRKRRSIRKYQDKPVEWDKVVKIIEAARLAPSSGNIQNWKFIIVREYSSKKKIAHACFDQGWIEEVPVLIVAVVDSEQAERFYGTRGERLYSIQNCAAAIENMLLAATDLGLGSCWVGAFDESLVRTIVQLPEHVIPHAVITIGYADEEPLLPQKKRIEWIIGLEKWVGRMKKPIKGYTSEVIPSIIEGAKRTVKRHIKKLVK